jgi:hypothetical protein
MTESKAKPSDEPVGSELGSGQQGGDGGRSTSITFTHPDVIFDIHPELLDTWGEGPFLAIKSVGFFLRVALQVRLDDGSRVDFGTWLEIDAEDFRTAWQTWNAPEYADLVVGGYVANSIAPWGEFPHTLVEAVVRDVDDIPVLASCPDLRVMEIIDRVWPSDQVLAPYADVLQGEQGAVAGPSKRRTAAKRGKRKAVSGAEPEAI